MIFKLPTLYKRDTNGNIRELTVEYSNGVLNATRTIAGIKDGNLVTSGWKNATGKNTGKANATTDAEQAQKEAKAMWDKKVEKEYFEDINLVDTYDKFKPQLAHDYPKLNEGQKMALDMISEIQELAVEAKDAGLAVVVWSYPRGGNISKEGETAIDIVSYAAHMAALVGAHIIKVKPPTSHIEQQEAKKVYISENIPIATLNERIKHVVQSCFNGKRLVVFSGGSSKNKESLLEEIKNLYLGGASGSIIGRNSFQRPYNEALDLLNQIINIYRGK